MLTLMTKLPLLVFLGLFLFLFCGFTPMVSPPASFAPCQSQDNPGIISSYLEKKSMKFSPSIVVFTESLKESKAEYEKKIKKHFTSMTDVEVSFLPALSTSYGKALMLQIDKQHQAGELRLMQMILIYKDKSYIVTCCALKKDFSSYEKKFLETLRSFRLA